jgi:4-carboxymuconolactone decarboxylase
MPRIPLLKTRDGLSPEQLRVYDEVVAGPRGKIQGPLLAVLHNPELADKWQQFGAMLRYYTSFPLRLSEVAILVTAAQWQCQLEWHLHEGFALAAEVPRQVVDDIHAGRRPSTGTNDDLMIYDYVCELNETRFVSEPTYQRVLRRWNTKGVMELTALTGYYGMVAMMLNAHEFPLPDGAQAPFPYRESV